jgi:hypothetical protein
MPAIRVKDINYIYIMIECFSVTIFSYLLTWIIEQNLCLSFFLLGGRQMKSNRKTQEGSCNKKSDVLT